MAIREYVKRTNRYLPFDIEVVPELKNTRHMTNELQCEKEAELLMRALQPGDTVVLLDEKGKELRSTEFAQYLASKMNAACKRLVFVVGGPYGFAPKMYAAANDRISLSKMTFSHQMVRLVFAEQIYRAVSILNGLPYHHE